LDHLSQKRLASGGGAGILSAGFLLAVVCLSSCRGPNTSNAASLTSYLKAARRAWNFYGAVLVARGEKVIFRGGYGFADAAGTRKNTPSTKFSIGSITKTLTAVAVLQLKDTGLVDLDAPVTDYVPEYSPPGSQGVTLRRLLAHSAGVPDVGLDPRTLGDLTKPRSPLDLIGLIRNKPLDFEPGTKSRYSNAGYVLLGLVIERVSGKSYADYLQNYILRPLGMSQTSYGVGASAETGLARGLIESAEGRPRDAPLFHPSLGYSAGGLFSTAEDMWKLNRGLEGDGILAAISRAQMYAPQRDGFGLGWLIMQTWGRRDIAHGGGAPGYSAWIESWPDDGVFLAVLSNTGGSPVGEIGRSLAAILFGRDVQVPTARRAIAVDLAAYAEYVGTYEIRPEGRREILVDGGRLFVRRDNGLRYPILPCEKDVFFFPNDKGATLRFVRDEAGRVSGHVFHQLGVDEIAEKVRQGVS
jgi:CubicO group peptidase (beta-lactamase class C family)